MPNLQLWITPFLFHKIQRTPYCFFSSFDKILWWQWCHIPLEHHFTCILIRLSLFGSCNVVKKVLNHSTCIYIYICLGVQFKICYWLWELFLLHACFLELTMHPQYNQLFQLRGQYSIEKKQLECTLQLLMQQPR